MRKKGDKLLTIELGYADGYSRALSSRGRVYAHGYYMPIIGVISMDMIIIDANELPDHIFNAIKYVEIIGKNITIDDLADISDTIGHEIIINRFGYRCKRIYEDS